MFEVEHGHTLKTFDNDANNGLIIDSDQLNEPRWKLKQNPPYSVLKEKVISDYVGLVLNKNNFIFDAMNRKVVQLVESGVAQKIIGEQVTKKLEHSGPQVLTLEQLKAGFYIWLVCIAISIFAFIWEKFNNLKCCSNWVQLF